MSSITLAILLATGLVSVFSLTGIFTISLSEKTIHKILFFLIAFSAGTILGASLFDLLPEAVELVEDEIVYVYIASGFVLFFMLERFIYWYHGHGHQDDIEDSLDKRASKKGFAYLNVFGDAVHNFIDGMVIAASFAVAPHVGVATTLAVIFHELPQEMGDFGILVYAGFENTQALLLNFIAALTVVAGGLFASFFMSTVEVLSGILIAFSSGSFIYLAASELVPELKKEEDFQRAVVQFAMFVLGLVTIWYLGVVFSHG